MRRSIFFLPLFLSTACIGDLTLVGGAQISCETEDDCPGDLICAAGVNRCVEASLAASKPPALDGEPTLDPEFGGAETVFTLSFKVTRDLIQNPVVHMDTGARVAPFEMDEEASDPEDRSYVYAYTVDGTEAAGDHDVLIDLVDTLGKEANNLPGGSLTLDFGPPALVTYDFSDDHSKQDARITVSFTLSEEAGTDPVVSLTHDSETVAMLKESGSGPTAFTYSTTAAAGMTEGTWEAFVVAEDRSGNVSAPLAVGSTVVDFQPPTFVTNTVVPQVAAPGQVIRAEVVLDQPPSGSATAVLRQSGLPDIPFETPQVDGTSMVFLHEAQVGEEGVFEVYAFGITDPAGNVMAETLVGQVTIDGVAPAIATGTFSQNGDRFGQDGVLTVTFETTEPLTLDPDVKLGTTPLVKESGSESGPWTYSLDFSGTTLNGTWQLYVTLVDPVGNTNFEIPGTATADTTPPGIVAATFSPQSAKLGTLATLTLTSTENLGDALDAATALGFDTNPGFAFQSKSGSNYNFTLDVNGTVPAGDYTLGALTLTDVAGNTITLDDTDPALPVVFNVDSLPPSATPCGSTPPDQVGDAAEVTVSFIVAESLASDPVVTLGSEVMDAAAMVESGCVPGTGETAYTFTFTTDANSHGEGPQAITVQMTDPAGNITTEGRGIVDFDFTPPDVVSTNVLPVAAKLGDEITYTVTVTEPLAQTPALNIGGAGTPTFSHQNGTEYIYTHTVTGSDADGAYTATIDLEDLAGNTNTGIAGDPFDIDASVPVISNVATNANTYSRVGGFNQVSLTFNSSEDVGNTAPGLNVTIGGLDMTNTCGAYQTSAPNYTCTYTVSGADTEGVANIAINLNDSAGNSDSDSTSVLFDFSAPTIVADSLIYTPGPKNLLNTVDAMTNDTRIDVTFFTNEPLDITPVPTVNLACNLGVQALTNASASTTFLEYNYTLLSGHTLGAGNCTLSTTIADAVGNSAARSLSSVPVVDRTAPSTTVIDTSLIKHLRAPWGGRNLNEGQFVVRADLPINTDPFGTGEVIPGAAFNSSELVGFAVYRDATGGPLLAQGARSGADWEPLVLGFLDSTRVHVAVIDEAGNESNRVAVDKAEWVATFKNKVARSTLENPHVFDERPWFTDDLNQGGAVEKGEFDGIATLANKQVTTPGAATWRKEVPHRLPKGRSGPAFVYDEVTASTFMYSGRSYNGCNGTSGATNICTDHWIWDGTLWSELPPPNDIEGDGTPIGNDYVGMVYDSARDQMVAMGPDYEANLWVWDREEHSWELLIPTDPEVDGNPEATWPMPIVYDRARQEIVYMVWGSSGDFETWIWNGSSWRNALPTDSPPRRGDHGLVYDEANQRVVLFGGYGDSCTGPSGSCIDTWTWDGVNWTQVGPPAVVTADNTPAARDYPSLAYDSARQRVVMFGGSCSPTCAETWEWDGTAWSKPTVTDVEGDGNPEYRDRSMMTYDAARGLSLLYAGQGDSDCDGGVNAYCGTLWGWNGSAWLRLAEGGPVDDQVPDPRERHAVAFDTVNGALVVHGGKRRDGEICDDTGHKYCSDTWVWDGALWTRHAPSGDNPGLRDRPDMAMATFGGGVAPAGEGLLLASGDEYTCTETSPDVWNCVYAGDPTNSLRWDGSSWTEVATTGAVDPQYMVYETATNRTLTIHDDARTKEWNLDGWGALTNSPAYSTATALTYDSVNNKIIQIKTAASYQTSVWEGTLSGTTLTWAEVDNGSGTDDPDISPSGKSASFDPRREKTVLFGGGIGGTTYTNAVWEWNGTTWEEVPITSLTTIPEPHGSHNLVYDTVRQEHLVFGGNNGISAEKISNELWALNTGYEASPGHVSKIRFGASGVDTDLVVLQSINADWFAQGRGYNGGTQTDGVELFVREYGKWRTTSETNTAAPTDPPGQGSAWTLSWTTTNAQQMRNMMIGPAREMHFAVKTTQPNGKERASLKTDYVEVRVNYQWQ
jgi:hypothetical protein